VIAGITEATQGSGQQIYTTTADAIVTRLQPRRVWRHTKGIAGRMVIGTGVSSLVTACQPAPHKAIHSQAACESRPCGESRQ